MKTKLLIIFALVVLSLVILIPQAQSIGAPPPERVPTQSFGIYNLQGNNVDLVNVGQQIQIRSDLTNGQDMTQSLAYIVEVYDEDGNQVFRGWIEATLEPMDSFSPAVSWIPEKPGYYKTRMMIWEALDNPSSLSPYLESEFYVAGDISVLNGTRSCNEGKELVFKINYKKVACVFPETLVKLLGRGWANWHDWYSPLFIDNLRQGPQDVDEVHAEFVKREVMKDSDVAKHFMRAKNYDYTCCTYQYNENDYPLSYQLVINFSDLPNEKQLVVVYDLRQTKVIDTALKDMVQLGGPIITEPEPIISEKIDLVVDANNQFAIDFYSQVTADKEENVFFSPWSITNAFVIAYEGARGNTADEMSNAFGFVKDDEKRRNAFASIHEDLNQKDAEYKLHVANALWIAEGFELFKEYVDTAKTYYDSDVNTVNFETNGADIINEWVKNKTEEKIEKLFDPNSLSGARLVITNAIYFNGTWVMPFDEKRTSEQDFIVNAQKTVKVPMMSRDSHYNYTDTDELQILELPYEGDRLSMLILLPNDVDGIKSIEESLSAQKISQWNDELLQKRLFVQIPKFTMETDYNLVPELKKLGINAAFGPADFSGISNADLFISQAVHKAFVDVNEVGTEAAAATGIVMLESMPPSFMADHPFVFIIQDKETGVILFMGKVVDPTA